MSRQLQRGSGREAAPVEAPRGGLWGRMGRGLASLDGQDRVVLAVLLLVTAMRLSMSGSGRWTPSDAVDVALYPSAWAVWLRNIWRGGA